MAKMPVCDSSTPYYADFVTVTESLRCPVCQGQRIASSDSPFSLKVKEDICAALQAGLQPDQVTLRMEAAYGADLHVEKAGSFAMLPLMGMILFVAVVAIRQCRRMVIK